MTTNKYKKAKKKNQNKSNYFWCHKFCKPAIQTFFPCIFIFRCIYCIFECKQRGK